MGHDFEDLYDTDDLSDPELRELVAQKFEEQQELDAEALDIAVSAGRVRVTGRVGTEEEVQEVDVILGDTLGISDFDNQVIVDEVTRAERAEGADDAQVEDRAVVDELGEGGKRTEESAEHLLPDTEGELYGTADVQKAIERGESYNPPDRPPQMGSRSRENH